MDQRLSAKRWLSFALALGMLLSTLCVSAFAVDINDAKASVANVKVTQTYKFGDTQKTADSVVHDYRTDGDGDVLVDYKAELSMTEEMATYLCARQNQLYDAQFTVNLKIDLDQLEWVTNSSGHVTFTFTSSFLKPVYPEGITLDDYSRPVDENGNRVDYEIESTTRDNGMDRLYQTRISATPDYLYKMWDKKTGTISIPVELIAWDGDRPYTFSEMLVPLEGRGGVKYTFLDMLKSESFTPNTMMYAGFTVEDWMKPITLTANASLKVKEATRQAVTPSNSVTITAGGTVSGTFSYITAEKTTTASRILELLEMEKTDGKTYHNTLAFGTGTPEDITDAWTSNKVVLKLIHSVYVDPDTPTHLNTEDHFAYIIGRTNGDGSPATASPEANITRAEVATIFFRMLKDDSRSLYWSSENDYPDVDSDAWYNNAVSTLTNMGIITGRDGGVFAPDEPITRAEFATIAVRFFDTGRLETLGDAFSDISGKWYTQYINYAAMLELVNGRPDGTYHPDDNITRAEAMTIVNNTLRRTPAVSSFAKVKNDMIVWEDNMDTAKWYYAAVQEATNSHDYQRASTGDTEVWTKILPVRDWAAFEKEWSDANSAKNPGDVVDGNP